MAIGVAALAASVAGYATGYAGFGTAAGVIALAVSGVGLGKVNDAARREYSDWR